MTRGLLILIERPGRMPLNSKKNFAQFSSVVIINWSVSVIMGVIVKVFIYGVSFFERKFMEFLHTACLLHRFVYVE
jgi:hypothetical protein